MAFRVFAAVSVVLTVLPSCRFPQVAGANLIPREGTFQAIVIDPKVTAPCEVRFTYDNPTAAELCVPAVRTSCSCMGTSWSSAKIEPGGTAVLTVQVAPDPVPVQGGMAWLHWNDKAPQLVQWQLVHKDMPPVMVAPSSLRRAALAKRRECQIAFVAQGQPDPVTGGIPVRCDIPEAKVELTWCRAVGLTTTCGEVRVSLPALDTNLETRTSLPLYLGDRHVEIALH